MLKKTVIIIILGLILVTRAYAGAMIQRRQQMAQQQQQAAQQQAALQKQAIVQQQLKAQAIAQKQQQMRLEALKQQRAFGNRQKADSLVENETLELYQIWELFEEKSDLWAYMVEQTPKVKTVQRYIDAYAKQGIYIRKDAYVYVEMIDDITRDNAVLLNGPFADVLKFVAIMEYDFDNGKDKNAMARSLLGDKVYQENKMRLGRQ